MLTFLLTVYNVFKVQPKNTEMRKPGKRYLTRIESHDIVQCMQRGVAQLVARLLWEQEVRGSNPRIPIVRE